jgi:hypothetical protein
VYHCGICFALQDMTAGTELTVNYEYILSADEADLFVDTLTGAHVRGLPGELALARSARELLQLFDGVGD